MPTPPVSSIPVGRISVHEDRDNDGVYETHKVFVDHLIFPRFVLPFGANAILTKESNSDDVWKFTDTNGDGTSDKKELFTSGLGRLLNVEHQESGFTWGLDNWIYSTINSARVRWTPGRRPAGADGIERRPVGDDPGQLRQDLVPGRCERDARLLPAANRLRQLRLPRSVRTRSEHHLGRPGADCRHAGRHERDADARRLARARDRGCRQRCLPRRSPARRHAW